MEAAVFDAFSVNVFKCSSFDLSTQKNDTFKEDVMLIRPTFEVAFGRPRFYEYFQPSSTWMIMTKTPNYT